MLASLSEDSLAKFRKIAEADPSTNLFVRRLTADTYEQFIDVLYEDMDQVIKVIQERKQIYFDAGEDQITMYLVDLLKQRGYGAEHDTKIGGHVDVVIRGRDPRFLWLGEAKRDNGPAWLEQGMEQLVTRYSDGSSGRSHGGILVYIQGKFAATILRNWRGALSTCTQFEDLVLSDCKKNSLEAFVSTHTHETSGLKWTHPSRQFLP